MRKGGRPMELKFFQFYFRQLLVIREYIPSLKITGLKKTKECEHYFKTNILNFIVKVCLELKKNS